MVMINNSYLLIDTTEDYFPGRLVSCLQAEKGVGGARQEKFEDIYLGTLTDFFKNISDFFL